MTSRKKIQKNTVKILSTIFFIVIIFQLVSVSAAEIGVQLQIPIAGHTSFTVCHPGGDKQLLCTGIGEYITVIYKWAIGFAAVLAVVALTYGGVLWMTAGGGKRTDEAKKVITNAIAGLLLALCSYLLLAAINPDLVNFQPISVTSIAPIQLKIDEVPEDNIDDPGSDPAIGQGNVPYYNQADARWGTLRASDTGTTVRRGGCGITSFAMVAKFYGKDITPKDVLAANGGTLITDFEALKKIYSLPYDRISDFTKVDQLVREGKPVILYTQNSHFTLDKHFIVITGFDGTNYLVNDPGHRANKTATKDELSSGALYYIYVHP